MRILSPQAHGIIDLVTVLAFALAPVALGLEGFAGTLSYLLAAVHLVMSLATAELPISIGSVVPLAAHGLVEGVVGLALGVIGWLAFEDTAQTFYLLMGIVILLVFSVSRYTTTSGQA